MAPKTPENRPSSPGNPQTNIQIDRIHYRVEVSSLTGQELRNLVAPPIPDTRDLFRVVPGGEDEKIEAGATLPLHDGMRFFTAPATINPGSLEADHGARG